MQPYRKRQQYKLYNSPSHYEILTLGRFGYIYHFSKWRADPQISGQQIEKVDQLDYYYCHTRCARRSITHINVIMVQDIRNVDRV